MKATFCDACGDECIHATHSFRPLMHIVEMAEGKDGGYVDPDWNPVSGREEHYDLCTPCYNDIFATAYKALKAIREKENISTE